MWTSDTRVATSRKVVEHVEQAWNAIQLIMSEGVRTDGVLKNPGTQAAAMKMAREELSRAIDLVLNEQWERG